MKKCIKNRRSVFTALIFAGIVVGIGLGFLLRYLNLDEATLEIIALPGTLFLRSIYLLIAPLVLTSIISGIAGSNVTFLKKIRIFLPAYCLTTSMLGVLLSLSLHFIRSGIMSNTYDSAQDLINGTEIIQADNLVDPKDMILDIFTNLIPSNIVRMFFQISKTELFISEDKNSTKISRTKIFVDTTNMCGIIYFSLFFGIVLLKTREKTKEVKSFILSANNAIVEMLRITMMSLPIAIVFLIGKSLATAAVSIDAIKEVAIVNVIIVFGYTFHCMVTLNIIYYAITRSNPFTFAMKMKDAIMTAWVTTSSAVTLPATIRCVEENNIAKSNIAKVMLPIAATVNMDGSSIYLCLSVLYMAAHANVPQTVTLVATVMMNSLILGVATAAIPGAIFVALIATCNMVNVPTDLAVLFLAMDPIVDRFGTACNVYGDCVGAAIAGRKLQNSTGSETGLDVENFIDSSEDGESTKVKEDV